jgi:hypothetical protein
VMSSATGNVPPTMDRNACKVTGSVDVTNGNAIAVGESYGGLYNVSLAMATNADDFCQGATLNYNLTINAAS